MKKALLLFTATMLFLGVFAQEKTKAPATFGILGAANLSKFNVDGGNLDYKFKTGSAVGFYFNFPLSQRVSLEPQFLFITNKLQPETAGPGSFSGKINYFGIPLLLNIHAGKYVSFPVGVQLDFRTSVNDDANLQTKDHFESFSVGPTAGIEIRPIDRVSIFGRYIYGLNQVNTGPLTQPNEFKNQNIYAGVKIKLFDLVKKKVVPPPLGPVLVNSKMVALEEISNEEYLLY